MKLTKLFILIPFCLGLVATPAFADDGWDAGDEMADEAGGPAEVSADPSMDEPTPPPPPAPKKPVAKKKAAAAKSKAKKTAKRARVKKNKKTN